jgi:pyridoxine 4-dehydrogenase
LYRADPDRRLVERALELGVRGIDAACNYRGFRCHRMLATCAGDLLDRFVLSTKVGFFPAGGTATHSLDVGRLRVAVERSAAELGRAPDVVLLHNPERSLTALPRESASDRLDGACQLLDEMTGAAGAWRGASRRGPAPRWWASSGSTPPGRARTSS